MVGDDRRLSRQWLQQRDVRLAGCEVGLRGLDRRDGTWSVRCELDVEMEYARDGTGVYGAAIGAFDRRGRLLAATALGDLTWAAVPEEGRRTIHDECEGEFSGGSLAVAAELSTDD